MKGLAPITLASCLTPGIAAVSREDSRNPKASSHRGGEELGTRSSYFMSQKSKETRLDLLVFEKH